MVRRVVILNCQYLQFNNLKLQTSNLANHHLDVIKQLKELQFRILDQELNRWKREQQLSGNGAPFHNNLDTIQKWCEDLALIIWNNMQQMALHNITAFEIQFQVFPPGGLYQHRPPTGQGQTAPRPPPAAR